MLLSLEFKFFIGSCMPSRRLRRLDAPLLILRIVLATPSSNKLSCTLLHPEITNQDTIGMIPRVSGCEGFHVDGIHQGLIFTSVGIMYFSLCSFQRTASTCLRGKSRGVAYHWEVHVQSFRKAETRCCWLLQTQRCRYYTASTEAIAMIIYMSLVWLPLSTVYSVLCLVSHWAGLLDYWYIQCIDEHYKLYFYSYRR